MRLFFIFLTICLVPYLYGQDMPVFNCTVEQNLFEVDYPIKITYSLLFENGLPNEEDRAILKNLNIPNEVLTKKIGEDSGESFKYENGKSKTKFRRSFIIKIQKLGNFTIPPVNINYKGKKLSTEAVTVTIIAKKEPSFSDITKEAFNSKVFIRAELENGKETCMLGERIIINTVIYTQIDIEEMKIEEELGKASLHYLSFFNKNSKGEEVKFKGKKYYKKILRSYTYNALMEKEVLISPTKISIGRIANPARSALDESNILRDTLSSNQLVLKIKASQDRAVDYEAKNGTEIKWSLNDSLMDKGVLLLNVDLIGTGVYLFYNPPKLDFGDRATVKIAYMGQEYLDAKTIKKSFQYVINCHKIGDFDIQLDWSTWDTEKNERQVLSKSIETIKITQTSPRKRKLTNINPIEHVKESKRDIALVVDCSASMLAKDFDSTRFQAIQDLIRHLIHQKANDERFSIVLVAGESFILCPLTFSASKLLSSVDEMKTGYLMEGTDFTDGIMQGTLSLSESKNSSKSIIIFTDGASNRSYLDRDVIIKVAQEQKVQLNVVGIGIDGEFLVPVAKNAAGNFIYEKKMLKIETEELKNIAKDGGGIYTRINNSKQLKLDFNSLLGKSNLLLLNKEELIAPELVLLLLEDANYRHQKTKKEYINIKDK